jgi:pyridoxine 5-phosphate synthase
MTSIKRLGANIDHVATIRQARGERYPDPVVAASIAELAGADQITCHIRGDRRHIIDSDLPRLRDIVQTQLNVEMAATEEMCRLVIPILAVHPNKHRITLVPEREGEVTTEGGLDVIAHRELIEQTVKRITDKDIFVSLFIDPDPLQIEASVMDGVDMIEINTARYCEGHKEELLRIKKAAQKAQALGFEVAAGHGLTHHNLPPMVSAVPEITEYNIGHSMIARSIFVGLDQAVRDILHIIRA